MKLALISLCVYFNKINRMLARSVGSIAAPMIQIPITKATRSIGSTNQRKIENMMRGRGKKGK